MKCIIVYVCTSAHTEFNLLFLKSSRMCIYEQNQREEKGNSNT